MARHPFVDPFIIRVGRVLQFDTTGAQLVNAAIEVVRSERDVLNTFTSITPQELLDLVYLTVFALALIERNADLATRARHRLREKAGNLTFDVEVLDFTEIEDTFIVI